jgi:hypothetical protein
MMQLSHVLYKSAKVLNKVGNQMKNDIEIPETYKKLRLGFLTP